MAAFTVDGVLDAMRAVVAERGADFVYERPTDNERDPSFYVYKGAPSCLVGHVLHRLGVDLGRMAAHEGENPEVLADSLHLDGYYEVWAVLDAAQVAQDEGDTWGEALENAEARAAELTEGAAR